MPKSLVQLSPSQTGNSPDRGEATQTTSFDVTLINPSKGGPPKALVKIGISNKQNLAFECIFENNWNGKHNYGRGLVFSNHDSKLSAADVALLAGEGLAKAINFLKHEDSDPGHTGLDETMQDDREIQNRQAPAQQDLKTALRQLANIDTRDHQERISVKIIKGIHQIEQPLRYINTSKWRDGKTLEMPHITIKIANFSQNIHVDVDRVQISRQIKFLKFTKHQKVEYQYQAHTLSALRPNIVRIQGQQSNLDFCPKEKKPASLPIIPNTKSSNPEILLKRCKSFTRMGKATGNLGAVFNATLSRL